MMKKVEKYYGSKMEGVISDTNLLTSFMKLQMPELFSHLVWLVLYFLKKISSSIHFLFFIELDFLFYNFSARSQNWYIIVFK